MESFVAFGIICSDQLEFTINKILWAYFLVKKIYYLDSQRKKWKETTLFFGSRLFGLPIFHVFCMPDFLTSNGLSWQCHDWNFANELQHRNFLHTNNGWPGTMSVFMHEVCWEKQLSSLNIHQRRSSAFLLYLLSKYMDGIVQYVHVRFLTRKLCRTSCGHQCKLSRWWLLVNDKKTCSSPSLHRHQKLKEMAIFLAAIPCWSPSALSLLSFMSHPCRYFSRTSVSAPRAIHIGPFLVLSLVDTSFATFFVTHSSSKQHWMLP